MNNLLSDPLKLSIFIYIIIIIVVLCYRPSLFYVNNDSNSKKLKIFGTGSKNNKTIFQLWLIIYFLCCLISSYIK